MTTENLNMDYSKYDFKDSTEMYIYLSKKGLSRGTVEEVSKLKGEPQWMLDFRLRSYEDRKSTRLNSSHIQKSRMPSSA